MVFQHNRFISRNFLLGSLTAVGLLSANLQTAAAADAPGIKVSYADLDLSRSTDVQVLYGRLQRAAADVCGPSVSSVELSRYMAWKRCYEPALHNAVLQVGAPQLLARYGSDSAGKHART